MNISFSKYEGAGNDFILIDNRHQTIQLSQEKISKLCHRRFGIGADGLMLLENDSESDFRMKYYNSDGLEGSMCGNGGRCIVSFAHQIGIIKQEYLFNAVDGLHKASLSNGIVNLKMSDIENIEKHKSEWFLDTGSPHVVKILDDIKTLDIDSKGKELRFDKRFGVAGTNVNFINIIEDSIYIRTYERGVEEETLACGTGAVASAIVAHHINNAISSFKVFASGGNLNVSFKFKSNKYSDIWLSGPATKVFNGIIDLKN